MRRTTLAPLLLLAGCAGTPVMRLDIESTPSGAQVSIQRRGERNYVGSFGPVSGSLSSNRFEEEWVPLGTTPVAYSTPLKETTTDATLLGVGGRVVKRFEDALVRFELEGYAPTEKFVRFEKGEGRLVVELTPAP